MKRPPLLRTRLDGLRSTQFSRLSGHLDLLPRGPGASGDNGEGVDGQKVEKTRWNAVRRGAYVGGGDALLGGDDY